MGLDVMERSRVYDIDGKKIEISSGNSIAFNDCIRYKQAINFLDNKEDLVKTKNGDFIIYNNKSNQKPEVVVDLADMEEIMSFTKDINLGIKIGLIDLVTD